MVKEKWIIAISNTAANGIRLICVLATLEQIKESLMESVYDDRSNDEEEFYSGTNDISEIEEKIRNGELYALNAYNTFSDYYIEYSAQRLSKMQYCEL